MDDDELKHLAAKWEMSVDRLRFLKACPHMDRAGYVKVADFKGRDKVIANAIREAIRQSWMPIDAAKIAKVRRKTIDEFVAKHGIKWPEGCRRRLTWGGGGTQVYQQAEKEANLLASRGITLKDAVRRGVAEGLTAKETAEKYNFAVNGMFNTARRMGLKFASHFDKFGRKTKPTDPLLAEARASVQISLNKAPKA